jgi:hypothetical protein
MLLLTGTGTYFGRTPMEGAVGGFLLGTAAFAGKFVVSFLNGALNPINRGVRNTIRQEMLAGRMSPKSGKAAWNLTVSPLEKIVTKTFLLAGAITAIGMAYPHVNHRFDDAKLLKIPVAGKYLASKTNPVIQK